MRDDKTLHPRSGYHRDINRLFRDHVLRKSLASAEQIEKAEILRKECSEEINPWLHHCLVAQDVLTETEVRKSLDEIRWKDDTLDEKVSFLRMYVGNMDTITDIHKVLLKGEDASGSPSEAEAPRAVEGPSIERMIVSFEMGEQIAEDKLSRTFRASDRLTGRAVSLRVLRDEFKEKSDTVNLFLHGAKVVSVFDHPNVVPVFSVGVMRSGAPFIAKPRIKTSTLLGLAGDLNATKKKGAPASRLVNLFLQVLNAVRAAHASSVLHRRINPVHVLVGTSGEAYLDGWDFGKIIGEPDLAKASLRLLMEKNCTDETVLTGEKKRAALASLPPEIIEGTYQDVNERSDVYSLGAVLFFLLTGSEPVGGLSACDILNNTLQGALVLKTGAVGEDRLPGPLLEVCRKALSFEPEDRYPSADSLLNATQAAL